LTVPSKDNLDGIELRQLTQSDAPGCSTTNAETFADAVPRIAAVLMIVQFDNIEFFVLFTPRPINAN